MRLQLTLDLLDMEEALSYTDKVYKYTDILEIGTPLSMKYGFAGIREIKKRYPDTIVLADNKIADGGRKLTNAVLSAGADIVTVLGIADEGTLRDAVATAHEHKKEILIDSLGVKDLASFLGKVDEYGADYVGIHVGVDEQKRGATPVQKLKLAKSLVMKTKVSVAGGLKMGGVLDEVIALEPDVVIVGSGVYSAENQQEEAKKIYELLHRGK